LKPETRVDETNPLKPETRVGILQVLTIPLSTFKISTNKQCYEANKQYQIPGLTG